MMLTHALLYTGLNGEADAVAHVNAALAKAEDGGRGDQAFNEIEMNEAGGRKFFTHGVYAAAFNYMPHQALRDALDAAPWRAPWDVVLIIDADDLDEIEDVLGPRVWRPAAAGDRTP